MHKFLSILLLITSLSLWAQPREGESEEDYKKRVLEELGVQDNTQKEEPVAEAQAEDPQLNNPNQDAPANSEDLEGQLDSTVKDFAGMGGMNQQGKPAAPVKPVKIKDSFLTKVMSSEAKTLIGTLMVKSPFQDMERKSLEEFMLANTQGTPLSGVLKNNKKVKNIFLDFLQSDKAIPALAKIVNKPEKVKFFSIFAGCVVVLIFVLNLLNSKGGIVKRILKKIAIVAMGGILNIGCAVYLFKEDFDPLINIVLKYYHL
jgi:hypothetical protein